MIGKIYTAYSLTLRKEHLDSVDWEHGLTGSSPQRAAVDVNGCLAVPVANHERGKINVFDYDACLR